MRTAPFTLQEIAETITWDDEPDEAGDCDYAIEYDAGAVEPADLRAALDALEAGCWDNLDVREAELLAYPADSSMDPRTGAYESTTLVIKARRPEWLERLLVAYEERNRRRRARMLADAMRPGGFAE